MTKLITLDFETYYDKNYSLSKMTTEAYIRSPEFSVIGVGYKIDDGPCKWISGWAQDELLSLDIPNSYLLCHNAAFDGAILSWHYNIKPKYYLDTLSMSRPITAATVGGSLAKLATAFNLGEKGTEVVNAIGKRLKDFSPFELEAYGNYCRNDVQLTYDLYQVLRPYSTPKEQFIIDLMIRMFTDPVLELDTNVLKNHLDEVTKKKEKLLADIDASIDRSVLMSNPQFAKLLQDLGVDPPMKTSLRTGKETYAFGKTDTAFKALLEHESEEVQAVVAARLGVKSTLEQTRTEAFIGISERGPLPIMLNYYGAHTGRASGGDKINLQNLPRGGNLRKSIAAPRGHKIIAVDSSQIEARVVAWLSSQEDLLEDFRAGVDIYSKFASGVYGREINKAVDKVERFVGKTCILGLGYGMGATKFKSTLKIGMGGISVDLPDNEAERIVKLYRDTYPHIATLWKRASEALNAMAVGNEAYFGEGVMLSCTPEGIYLPNGMTVRYNNLRKQEDGFVYDNRYGSTKIYGGKVVENVVQALARIVVFDQMAKIEQNLRKLDSGDKRYRVVLTVHDEVVAVVPEADAEATLAMMTEIMSTPPSWAITLPVSCEGDVGDTYGDCK
jgi:DNA polymerase I-like protein with 3'-5' exonuclease and polymerase domains